MVSRNGKPPPAPAGGDKVGRGQRPAKPVHAHDEFELDIDVDSDFTEVGTANAVSDLFGDDDDDERTQEVTLDQLEEIMRPKSDASMAIPLSSNEEVLPIFLPRDPLPPPRVNTPRPRTEPLPEPPLPPAAARRGVALPDLSDIMPEEQAIARASAPEASDLFDDISEVSDEPPIHSLLAETAKPRPPSQPLTPLPQPPPSRTSRPGGKKPRFATGLTGGMAPLDMADFESSQGQAKGKKRRRRRGAAGSRPAPMAGSQRVVRRWFQVSLRDVILLVLIAVIGLGVYVGWRIWQDYKTKTELGAYDQGRYRMEQARDDAIERTQPKKQNYGP